MNWWLSLDRPPLPKTFLSSSTLKFSPRGTGLMRDKRSTCNWSSYLRKSLTLWQLSHSSTSQSLTTEGTWTGSWAKGKLSYEEISTTDSITSSRAAPTRWFCSLSSTMLTLTPTRTLSRRPSSLVKTFRCTSSLSLSANFWPRLLTLCLWRLTMSWE